MKRLLILIVAAVLALQAGIASAGRLGSFESDVTTPSSGGYTGGSSDSGSSDDDCSPLFGDCPPPQETEASSPKVAMFPREGAYLRTDLRYHDAFGGVVSYDLQLEKAMGPFGVSARYYLYQEQNPSATLGVAGIYMLYRPPASKGFQVDLGVGLGSLLGQQTSTGLSLTLPIHIRLSEHVSLSLAPTMTYLANNLNEMNAALETRYGQQIYIVGYKSLNGPTQKLDGPYLGFAHLW